MDAIVELDAMARDASFPERAPTDRQWKRRRLAALREDLRRDRAGIYVAEHEGRVVGFVFARLVKDAADELPFVHISSIAVEPAWRRRGIASRLMEQVEALARLAGVDTVELEVSLVNLEAMRLYERRGYVTYRAVMKKAL